MNSEYLLPIIVATPAVGAILLNFINKSQEEAMRMFAVAISAITFFLTLQAWFNFSSEVSGMQMVFDAAWIPNWNINLTMGVDGISLPLVMLTSGVSLLALMASWSIKKAVKGYLMLFLLLESGMLGVFVSLDFFLFYVFWEVMLLPMYFLIGIWGGARKEYAAIKFFLYTLVGSVLMLIAMLMFYFNSGRSFDLLYLARVGQGLEQGYGFDQTTQLVAFILLFIGFAIKLPAFPFHTWLPDAHVEAPTPISMILAGGAFENGWLRNHSHRFPFVSLRSTNGGLGIGGDWCLEHHLRSLCCSRTNRLQTNGGLQFCFSHGICADRNGCLEYQ